MDVIVTVCRALANNLRLHMFRLVCQQPGTTVKELADDLGVSESIASRNLRVLIGGCLIDARPSGRVVQLHLMTGDKAAPRFAQSVGKLLAQVFGDSPVNSTLSKVWNWVAEPGEECADDREEALRRMAFTFTAYTHLRRLLILRCLASAGPCTPERLCREIGMSSAAASRQLTKLRQRGLVTTTDSPRGAAWELTRPEDPPLTRELHVVVMGHIRRQANG